MLEDSKKALHRLGNAEVLHSVAVHLGNSLASCTNILKDQQESRLKLCEEFEDFKKALHSLDKPRALHSVVVHLGNILASFTNILKEQQAPWLKLSKELHELRARIIQSGSQFESKLQEKAEALGRYGWTIPMEAGVPEVYDILNAIHDEASSDQVFAAYFTEDRVSALIEHTLANSNLEKWKPLVTEALDCLKEKRYRICTAGLLPIIEGLCAQTFNLTHFEGAKEREKFFIAKREQLVESGPLGGALWANIIAFLETIFQYAPFENPDNYPKILNRHVLLHGRSIPQANREDCLRLLLALDTISQIGS
jgi:hypothetical protein